MAWPPCGRAHHLELLRGFRETLRDLLFANNGEGDAAEAWERMRPFLASTRLDLAVDPTHGLELRPEDKGPIASLLAIVYESQLVGTWPRLRACRKESCRFAYYDHTKNGVARLVQHGHVRQSSEGATAARART